MTAPVAVLQAPSYDTYAGTSASPASNDATNTASWRPRRAFSSSSSPASPSRVGVGRNSVSDPRASTCDRVHTLPSPGPIAAPWGSETGPTLLTKHTMVTPWRSRSHFSATAPAATRATVSRADERPPPDDALTPYLACGHKPDEAWKEPQCTPQEESQSRRGQGKTRTHDASSHRPTTTPRHHACSTNLICVVRVARSRNGRHGRVVLLTHVAIVHQQGYWSAKRETTLDARQDGHAVCFLARCGDTRLAWPTTIQLRLDVGFTELHARRATVYYCTYAHAMGLAKGCDAKHASKGAHRCSTGGDAWCCQGNGQVWILKVVVVGNHGTIIILVGTVVAVRAGHDRYVAQRSTSVCNVE